MKLDAVLTLSAAVLKFASVIAITLTPKFFSTWYINAPTQPPFQLSKTKHSGTAVAGESHVAPGVYCFPIELTFATAAGLLVTKALSMNRTLIVIG